MMETISRLADVLGLTSGGAMLAAAVVATFVGVMLFRALLKPVMLGVVGIGVVLAILVQLPGASPAPPPAIAAELPSAGEVIGFEQAPGCLTHDGELGARGRLDVEVDLVAGDVVEVSVVVGQSGRLVPLLANDVRLVVYSETGVLRDFGRVVELNGIPVRARESGRHTILIDNGHSLVTTKPFAVQVCGVPINLAAAAS